MRVLIDPGHGGADPGTQHDQLVEKDYTLMMARLSRQALVGLGWGVEVELTRDDDIEMSLRAREQVAKVFKADLSISLHVNAAPDDRAQGAMMFLRSGDNIALAVAGAMQDAMPAEVRRSVNWLHYVQPMGWLARANNVVTAFDRPSLLLEMGFATNTLDRMQLLSTAVQRGIVAAIVCGVAKLDASRVGVAV